MLLAYTKNIFYVQKLSNFKFLVFAIKSVQNNHHYSRIKYIFWYML